MSASGDGLRRVCLFLLAANLAYCVLSAFGDAPAWGMFSRVERAEFALRDAAGRPVDLRAYVPPVFYFANAGVIREAAACACRKAPGTAPWTLTLGGRDEVLCRP